MEAKRIGVQQYRCSSNFATLAQQIHLDDKALLQCDSRTIHYSSACRYVVAARNADSYYKREQTSMVRGERMIPVQRIDSRCALLMQVRGPSVERVRLENALLWNYVRTRAAMHMEMLTRETMYGWYCMVQT